MGNQETVAKAKLLGWLDADNKLQPMMGDATTKTHESMPGKTAIPAADAQKMLMELATMAVIHRFHGTRPLAAEYQAASTTMMCEVGLRTPEAAQSTWTCFAAMRYGYHQAAISGTNAFNDRHWPTGSARQHRSCQAPSSSTTSAIQQLQSLLCKCYHGWVHVGLPYKQLSGHEA